MLSFPNLSVKLWLLRICIIPLPADGVFDTNPGARKLICISALDEPAPFVCKSGTTSENVPQMIIRRRIHRSRRCAFHVTLKADISHRLFLWLDDKPQRVLQLDSKRLFAEIVE